MAKGQRSYETNCRKLGVSKMNLLKYDVTVGKLKYTEEAPKPLGLSTELMQGKLRNTACFANAPLLKTPGTLAAQLSEKVLGFNPNESAPTMDAPAVLVSDIPLTNNESAPVVQPEIVEENIVSPTIESVVNAEVNSPQVLDEVSPISMTPEAPATPSQVQTPVFEPVLPEVSPVASTPAVLEPVSVPAPIIEKEPDPLNLENPMPAKSPEEIEAEKEVIKLDSTVGKPAMPEFEESTQESGISAIEPTEVNPALFEINNDASVLPFEEKNTEKIEKVSTSVLPTEILPAQNASIEPMVATETVSPVLETANVTEPLETQIVATNSVESPALPLANEQPKNEVLNNQNTHDNDLILMLDNAKNKVLEVINEQFDKIKENVFNIKKTNDKVIENAVNYGIEQINLAASQEIPSMTEAKEQSKTL